MRAITCAGGYAVPIVKGGMDILQISAVINDPTLASRLSIYDDSTVAETDRWGKRLTAKTKNQEVIADIKGMASGGGTIDIVFAEPIKIKRAISIVDADNLVAGKIFVFVR